MHVGEASDTASLQTLYEKQLSSVSEVDTELSQCVGTLRETMMDIIRKKREQDAS